MVPATYIHIQSNQTARSYEVSDLMGWLYVLSDSFYLSVTTLYCNKMFTKEKRTYALPNLTSYCNSHKAVIPQTLSVKTLKSSSLRPRTHVSGLCFKTEILPLGLAACPPHVSGENGHLKRIFSKALSRVEMYENSLLLYSCGWMKTDVFEN